ncbi:MULTISPECIES: helix-turn-helix domain-containing protein [Streptomyces]|uniref:Helix-turn-helix domain-containing protein n=1 Tax=Streptomyces eurythermus TaxID=42237 RepID=A0ABW6Z5U9_9ACTN|nr:MULTISPECIES: helix-turn-helix domain-containing protein [Streptomyces]QIS75084.1 helix-turn-helix domain-containing protein [Streptomyces sp. DSM 40868]
MVELVATADGNEVVLRDGQARVRRVSLKELLFSGRAVVDSDNPGPAGSDPEEIATVVLGQLSEPERQRVRDRAGHIREVLTGYRSGTSHLALPGEPRPEYTPELSAETRYAAKIELGIGLRTLKRWIAEFRSHGEAGLAPKKGPGRTQKVAVDDRWSETALEVMVEHTGESKPSRTMVIERTRARVIARYGPDVVPQPSRASAFRLLAELERRHPLFRLGTKRS